MGCRLSGQRGTTTVLSAGSCEVVYVNVSKISSVGAGAYAVTFDKKIIGTSAAGIEEKCKALLISEEGKAITHLIGQIGPDPTWEQHFAQANK